MTEKREHIKINFSRIRAEFQLGDIITTLFLLWESSKGRYSLKKELDLKESSVKSLLNYCKNNDLINSSIGRGGHSLNAKGKDLVKMISSYFKGYGFLNSQIFEGKENFMISLKSINSIPQSWKIRDIALSHSGKAILVLYVNENNELQFPEEEMQLNQFFPKIQKEIYDQYPTVLEENTVVLIIGASKKQIARKCAYTTVVSMIPQLNSLFIT